jgi:hypothetical protein
MLFLSSLITLFMITVVSMFAAGFTALFIHAVTPVDMWLEDHLWLALFIITAVLWGVWGWLYYGAVTFTPNTLHIIVGL